MGERFEMKLDAMAHGGDAIGRHEGRAIFVPYAIPGEVVRVELVEDHNHYGRARLLEVIAPSPARVDPPCPYFGAGKCGGCQWQHIDPQVQARIKGLVVMDQLERIGKFDAPPVYEPIPDETGWEYRNHALFRTDEVGRLGFYASSSHDVYPVDDCLILDPLLRQLLSMLDMRYPELELMELRAGVRTDDLMIAFQAKEEESPALHVDYPVSIVQIRHDVAIAPLIGLDYIVERFHDREFRISATSFYQVNTPQAERLIELVLEALELQGHERVLDAYSGIGMFAAFLCEQAEHVIAVEAYPTAAADAEHNLADADNVDIYEGLVADVLPDIEAPLDAIVIDPPRTGLEREVLDAIAAYGVARIVYVSCDPATFARDAQRLVRHGYALAWVQPVDMFPQTYHVETVALLTRST